MKNDFVTMDEMIEMAKTEARERGAELAGRMLDVVKEEAPTFREFDMALDLLDRIRMYLMGGMRIMDMSVIEKDADYIQHRFRNEE